MLENLYGCRFESARLKLELLLAESSLQWVNLEDAIGSPSVMRCLHSDIGDHAPVSNVTGNHWQNSNVAVNPMVNWFRCSFVLPVQDYEDRCDHAVKRLASCTQENCTLFQLGTHQGGLANPL